MGKPRWTVKRPDCETARTVLPDTVLVVDDEPLVLDVLASALRSKGFTVRTAGGLAEGLALVMAERWGCLLADKNLPDGSGLELIKAMRELQPDAACLVMTGYPNAESILQALRLGAVDYLEKPFPHLSIVQEKVRAAVDRQRLLAERADLHARVQALTAAHPAATPELLAQRAATEQVQAELDALNGQLDGLRFRHQRALTLLREARTTLDGTDEPARHALAAKVAALLDEFDRR